ncbi:hypothetical protein SAMN06265795_108121 [Noviherbaspirillum humi]|uniref:Uncharacterized protein n=1 Tax=Noviherbaspirillum humi TaxID=1688639 RepID=A0A239I841_9BURK|nr:hypothetical protein [Noviherbaspirillum humi]SNS88504.1 hypothetical protein SAMN06265795_108121 [Noviherbaspirillum humi]
MKSLILVIAASLLLAACGSGGDDAGTASAAPAPGAAGGTALDAFTSFVANLAASRSEDAEPVSADAIGLSTSETSEPAAL